MPVITLIFKNTLHLPAGRGYRCGVSTNLNLNFAKEKDLGGIDKEFKAANIKRQRIFS